MRRDVVFAAVAAAMLAATVVAQRSDPRDERSPRNATDRAAPDRARAPDERRASDPARPGEDGPPPGMGPDTKLEWLMLRPNRVRLRDSVTVGRVECRPWDAGANAEKTFVRVNAVMLRDAENADDKAAGIELVLEGEDLDRTFVFDADQIPDLIAALDAVDAAAQKLREAQPGTGRRAMWTLNGLEIGMKPRRAGGYLAPMSPDERSTGLSPDDFTQLKRLLQDAKGVIERESGK